MRRWGTGWAEFEESSREEGVTRIMLLTTRADIDLFQIDKISQKRNAIEILKNKTVKTVPPSLFQAPATLTE